MNVAKELHKLSNEPLDGIKVALNEEDVTEICAEITGPDSTPFEGAVFKVKLVLPAEYPNAPPKGMRPVLLACNQMVFIQALEHVGYFLTRIFHPNISNTGEICVNTLKKDWKSDLGIGHVLQVIRCLLINPFPESALNDEAAKMFMEEYGAYCRKARMMADVHASRQTKASCSKEESSSCSDPNGQDGEPVEKRQKPVENKAAEKRRLQQKKALKRL